MLWLVLIKIELDKWKIFWIVNYGWDLKMDYGYKNEFGYWI